MGHYLTRFSDEHPPWIRQFNNLMTVFEDLKAEYARLLMNIFYYPKMLQRPQMCTLLGIEPGLLPEFGFRPHIQFLSAGADRTEVDMRLGDILIEAKLTETGFQSASTRLLLRYRDLDEVFEIGELPIAGETVHAYQLIRGVLAAQACGFWFVFLCDGRRADLIERWVEVIRAVRSYSFRNRPKILTWQETARALPQKLRRFLEEKYGIFTKPGMDIGYGLDLT